MDEISRLLALAEADAELDRLIAVIHIAYEQELFDVAEHDVQLVRSLLAQHFGDSIDESPKRERPLTVSDVAARLERDRQVAMQDVEANRKHRAIAAPLPDNLSINAIRQLAQSLGTSASDRYWKAFRNTAITMQMASQQNAVRQEKPTRKGKDSK